MKPKILAQTFLHILGLSSLCTTAAFMLFAFLNMFHHGYFLALEPDLRYLLWEVGISVVALGYFAFLCVVFLRKVYVNQKEG